MDPRTPRARASEPGRRRGQGSARREQRSELSVRSGLRGIAVVVLAATVLAAGAWLLATSIGWLVVAATWC